jgi:Putative metal-binding motif
MRSMNGSSFLVLSFIALSSFGCSAGAVSNQSTGSGGNGGGASGGGGGQAGQGGEGGSGGMACTPTNEVCDGMDNDCDSQVDEDCGCIDGQTQDCYSGSMETKGIGACVVGQQKCDLTGNWGPCMGEVLPSPEGCNNVDDDCNGQVDDMGLLSCGIGGCNVMVLTCENGKINSCTPGTPSIEICDGIDNDCDQLVDETYPDKGMNCDTGKLGACGVGQTDCKMGMPICIQSVTPKIEQCNGLDDDCNGTVDDEIPGTGMQCGTGLPGVCNAGTYSCKDNVTDCFPNVAASAEICNGLDDDCDGLVDDGDPGSGATCMTGQSGICGPGIIHCNAGMLKCVPDAVAATETCNGVDDDCDGQIDEGNPGGNAACGCGGTTSCQNGALACIGGPTTYFLDDFSDNAAGWTMDSEWQIGPAVSGCSDPGTDYTPNTNDNGVAGAVLGGCYSTAGLHGYYYLTSPVINTVNATTLFLQYRRWLNSDYTPYANNTVEVFNGTTWTLIWQSGSTGYSDTSWQTATSDISIHKSANMRIRFGHNIGSSFAFSEGGWNIDDVFVGSASCP